MRRTQPHTENHANLERWLLTYADMITLLTAFFLMLYSMSVMSRGKFTALATSVRTGFGGITQGGPHILNGGGAHTTQPGLHAMGEYEAYKEAVRNLGRYVEEQKLDGKVSIREDERGVIISMVADNLLFPRGKAQLNPGRIGMLARVANIIRSVPNTIQIEGHTCDLPIRTALYPSNWELSSARAGATLRYFTEREGIPGRRFLAAGYADTRPLAPNATEASRAKNRRVDIVLLKTERQREAERLRRGEIERITAQSAPEAAAGNAGDAPGAESGGIPVPTG